MKIFWVSTAFALGCVASLSSAAEWRAMGEGQYSRAVEKCAQVNGHIPNALTLQDEFRYGNLRERVPELDRDYLIWTSEMSGASHIVVHTFSPNEEVILRSDYEYTNFILCQLDGGPGPGPGPDPYDLCSRYTPLGVNACLGNNLCNWSTDSRSCYPKTGFECQFYTQHGVTACYDAATSRGDSCGWSLDARQCFQEHGLPCSYYTQMGVRECYASSPQCEWSLDARQCYQR